MDQDSDEEEMKTIKC